MICRRCRGTASMAELAGETLKCFGVVARKCSGRSRVAEGHFGELKCAYGSHDEFSVLLFFRFLIIRPSESCVSVFDWPYLSSTCLRNSSS